MTYVDCSLSLLNITVLFNVLSHHVATLQDNNPRQWLFLYSRSEIITLLLFLCIIIINIITSILILVLLLTLLYILR